MRILIVEDDPRLALSLEVRLKAAGFGVDLADDGERGLYLGREYPVDLAVVDLGLPKLDGVSLIRHLRGADRRFPILILTARGDWQDKVTGLEAGADDYLVKPFHVEELLARVNALIRRAHGFVQPVLGFAPLALDTAARALTLDGQPIRLTAYEYRVLEYLMLNAGRVVSKTELTEHVYEQDFDRDSNTLEVFVRRLRGKLDPDGQLAPIETLRGQGYRFVLPPDAPQKNFSEAMR